MADKKISELTALTTLATDDEFVVVDTSAIETKKITKDNLATDLVGSVNLDTLSDVADITETRGQILRRTSTAWDALNLGAAGKVLQSNGTDIVYSTPAFPIAAPGDSNFLVGDGVNYVLESGATVRASLGLVIGTDVQAWDPQLDDIASLPVTDGNFIVGNGTNWVAESGATARTSLGLGTTDTVQFARLGLGRDADANHELAVNGSIFSSRVANTDGATIIMDWSAGNVHSVTLGGNRTIAWSNPADGQVIVVILRQDATGGRLVTWPETVSWPDGTAPTLTTTANKTDIFVCVRHATDNREYCQIVGLNF